MIRNYQKLKVLNDYSSITEPITVNITQPSENNNIQYILRMLIRPKYSKNFYIPDEISWLKDIIFEVSEFDKMLTGIKDSWCYLTIRNGPVTSETDDDWHFDGASFRTSIIPERNYVWVSKNGFQYKTGNINWPEDFDPNKYNLFTFAEYFLKNQPIKTAEEKQWYLVDPFCFHRRDPNCNKEWRTFIRISFPDIEGRDINNTQNSLLETPMFGRDPVKEFRNKLIDYKF